MENLDQFIQDAVRIARTPQGQQLIRTLQEKGGANLQQAVQRSAAGDIGQAKAVLEQLLADPETRKLLEQFGR